MFKRVVVDDVVKYDMDDLIDCRLGVITNNFSDVRKAKELDGYDRYSDTCFCVIATVSKDMAIHSDSLSYMTDEGDILEVRKLTIEETGQIKECVKNSSWIYEEIERLKNEL